MPQGSILGPLIFNIFVNDIFYVLEKVSNLYNYADDNTLLNTHHSIADLKYSLETSANLYNYADDNTLLNTHHSIADLKYSLETSATVAIQWFDVNGMKSNQAKFQAMILNN